MQEFNATPFNDERNSPPIQEIHEPYYQ